MDLQHEVDRLLEGSMALNTLNSYMTGLASYEKFLSIQGLENKWPPSTDNITHFIAYLSLQGLSFRTAQLYTSAIGYKCKVSGYPDVTQHFVVRKVLEGLTRLKSKADTRLPITTFILNKLVSVLPGICYNKYEDKMFKAAFTLSFWGLLRIGEIALSKGNNAGQILAVDDVKLTLDKLVIHLRFSKTDQAGKSVSIEIPKITGSTICPFLNVSEYLAIRPKSIATKPLFCHYNGTILTRQQFSALLSKSLKFSGIEGGQCKAHSFRIGGATALSLAGYSDEEIQSRGRWRSAVFKSYIRLPHTPV